MKNIAFHTFKSSIKLEALKDRLKEKLIKLATKGEKSRHSYISFFINLLMFSEQSIQNGHYISWLYPFQPTKK